MVGAPQFLHEAKLTLFRAWWLRRCRVDALVLRCLGTAIFFLDCHSRGGGNLSLREISRREDSIQNFKFKTNLNLFAPKRQIFIRVGTFGLPKRKRRRAVRVLLKAAKENPLQEIPLAEEMDQSLTAFNLPPPLPLPRRGLR